MPEKPLPMGTIEITIKIRNNDNVVIGESNWALPGAFYLKHLRHLNTISFNPYVEYCWNEAIDRADDYLAREERVEAAYQQALQTGRNQERG